MVVFDKAGAPALINCVKRKWGSEFSLIYTVVAYLCFVLFGLVRFFILSTSFLPVEVLNRVQLKRIGLHVIPA